jgi:hypothetical protein
MGAWRRASPTSPASSGNYGKRFLIDELVRSGAATGSPGGLVGRQRLHHLGVSDHQQSPFPQRLIQNPYLHGA